MVFPSFLVVFFPVSSPVDHRLVTFLSILLLNNAIFLHAIPTEIIRNDVKLQRQKRHVNYNRDDILVDENVVIPDQDLLLEGLLGCKYNSDICNQDEACFDDTLFGQCWNGKGSIRKAFAVENDRNGLTRNKLTALAYTIDFLNRYHLDWKDFMTQCILLHVLSNHHHLYKHHLEYFHRNCLEKEQFLYDGKRYQTESNSIRLTCLCIHLKDFYIDPYTPTQKSKNFFLASDASSMQTGEPSLPKEQFYANDNAIISIKKSTKPHADETQMNTQRPTKLSMQMNEGHPDLVETLQLNNNKQEFSKFEKNNTSKDTDTTAHFNEGSHRGYIIISRSFKDQFEAGDLLGFITQINSWPVALFTDLNVDRFTLTYQILDNPYGINASYVADSIRHSEKLIEHQMDIHIIESGVGNPSRSAQLSVERPNGSRLTATILVTCASVLLILGSFALFCFIRRNERIREKFAEITRIKSQSTNDYRDLCRQRMQTDGKTVPVQQKPTARTRVKHDSEGSSSGNSTSSWAEEPITPVNMDIMTGHLILSYMEDHLRDRHRLESDWQSLCTDEGVLDEDSCSIALSETNQKKNRYIDCIPYDHTRVRLENNDDGDYINASIIFDSNPKCKYIATQGPMPNTTNAFWQMVWEQGSCVIVALTRPIENGITMCHHYWPVEGSARFNDFEVNLISEHAWSEDYVVRSLYLRNVQTMETRTVTQFHFLTWDELCNPPSAKSILDFRRKVNKCFRGRASPIIIHCNDGVGRTGTYIMLDIVLNRIYKGAREINIAATLEHIRDQRAKMVKTKDQFQFVFVAVAEEVTYLLKCLQE
ncbi:unnamed protein product [Adineta ricciae]|uniref:Uncharacterized protein n=1 Tax=Adineta ricciae TaxID=249248 RepID=A0A813RM73_ADIRI|nr:unnamed protein product [Adineta ricciae]